MNTSNHLPIATASLEEDALQRRFLAVRARSETLARPLSAEDAQVQSMPDASPAKWHLAHTTWFFEVFVLRAFEPGFRAHDPDFHFHFNSYYEAEGARQPRPQRGLITRPGLAEVRAYRTSVTERLAQQIPTLARRDDWPEIAGLIELGCNHEEQHQELLLTDIKHALAQNPIAPAYAALPPPTAGAAPALRFIEFESGLRDIGHACDGFAFDNETPRHLYHVSPFGLASRPVTNGEIREFIDDGGYTEPRHWLSLGWDWVNAGGRAAPFYWECRDGAWSVFTLHGRRPIDWHESVAHLSYFEADAFARWAGARLPREQELEVAAASAVDLGPINDLDSGRLCPSVAEHRTPEQCCAQLEGDVWEWTSSAYSPYPGFKAVAGALGEYNGKFMCGQYVLRGGSCLTPPGHWRPTYRNFFPPAAQWQVSGLRLAKDL